MPIPNSSSRHCVKLNPLRSQLFFTEPSSHHHTRDFVRENKEFVREKSKQRHKQNLQNNLPLASYSTHYDGSQCCGNNSARGSSRQIGGSLEHVNDRLTSGTSTGSYLRQKKSREQQQSIFEFHQKSPPRKQTNHQQSTSTNTQKRNEINVRTVKPKSTAHSTKKSIAVQTDDIRDEIYLYNALKKCASPAFKSALKAKYMQKDEETRQKNSNHHYRDDEHLPTDDRLMPPNEGPNLKLSASPRKQAKQHDLTQRGKPCEKEKHNSDLASPKQYKHRASGHYFESDEITRNVHTDVNDQFNVMSLPPEIKKTCQSNVCADCPEGYHLLTEKEREHIKKKLLEREKLLIKQLNSFPLAIETLRVRQTKTRIERELSKLEESLHKLTKKKVYTKLNA